MKSYKTYILVIVIILFNTHLFSQGQGMGKGHNKSQNSQSSQTRFKSGNITQIVVYDSEEVSKKIKLKNKAKIAQVGLAIETYNDKMTEIKAFDSGSLSIAKTYIIKKIEEAKLTNNPYIIQEAQVKVREMLAPLRKKINTQNELLNSKFEKLLSEKQYNKWLKYQKSKLKPKAPSQNSQPQMQQRRGQGQGRGRRY